MRERLRQCLGRSQGEPALIADLTRLHGDAVARLLEGNGLKPGDIDVIGFHGHTILHRPEERQSMQIGDGRMLAKATKIAVVDDFRSRDVAAGGEGAPLAPLYHLALAKDLQKPLAVLNIGGVANVSYMGGSRESQLLAFDTGPGNALIDDWAVAAIGRPMDEGGRLARGGRVDEGRLADLLDAPYFRRKPPKSLDRNDFSAGALTGLSAADGAATLSALTVRAVGLARDHFPAPARRWLVSGGGRHNGALMQGLRTLLEVPVDPVEAVGWNGDMLEAQAFAFLAVRSLYGMPLSLPGTTGAPKPLSGGVLHRPGE